MGYLSIHCQVQHVIGKGELPPSPLPLPIINPNLPGILTQGGTRGGMNNIGMYREGLNLDQPPGPFRSLPCVVHNIGTGGG